MPDRESREHGPEVQRDNLQHLLPLGIPRSAVCGRTGHEGQWQCPGGCPIFRLKPAQYGSASSTSSISGTVDNPGLAKLPSSRQAAAKILTSQLLAENRFSCAASTYASIASRASNEESRSFIPVAHSSVGLQWMQGKSSARLEFVPPPAVTAGRPHCIGSMTPHWRSETDRADSAPASEFRPRQRGGSASPTGCTPAGCTCTRMALAML